jgi:hypothetical protein
MVRAFKHSENENIRIFIPDHKMLISIGKDKKLLIKFNATEIWLERHGKEIEIAQEDIDNFKELDRLNKEMCRKLKEY